MCGVSADRCIGSGFARWLFGSSMVGVLAVLFGGSVCAIVLIVLGDARPLLLSP